MPIQQGYERRSKENAKGNNRWGWYRWGDSGKKYYYTPGNDQSRKRARSKAEDQQAAAYASGYEG